MFSKAEMNVIGILTKGYSNRIIGETLGVKEKTVKYHLTNIYKKAGVKSRGQFIAKTLAPPDPENNT